MLIPFTTAKVFKENMIRNNPLKLSLSKSIQASHPYSIKDRPIGGINVYISSERQEQAANADLFTNECLVGQ